MQKANHVWTFAQITPASPLHSSFCLSVCVAEQSSNSNRIKCRKDNVPPGFSAPWLQEGLREGWEDLACVILKKHKGTVDKGGEGERAVERRLKLQGWMEAEAPGASLRVPAKHIYCSTLCEWLEGRDQNKHSFLSSLIWKGSRKTGGPVSS